MAGPPSSSAVKCDQEKLNSFLFSFNNNGDSKTVNTKLDFWKNNIISHCTRNNILYFDFKQLPELVAIDHRVPQCLDTVVHQLLREGTLQTMSDFKLACDPSWLSWVANKFVKKPFLGSFRRLIKDPLIHTFNWVVGSEDYNFDLYSSCKVDLPNDQLVLPALITALADQLYQRHTQQLHLSFADNIINYHIFMRSCSDLVSEEASFELAILSLCKRKLCRLITSDGEKFLVITHPSSSSSSSSSSTMVGNEDKIYRLKMLEMRLEKEVEKLEEKINQCRQTAKQFTKEGKSKMALMVLKKKKSLQDLLQHKYNNVDKVSSLLLSIQQTEHNKQLIDAFSSGVEAFKGVRERSGLSDDKLDATMLEVQETLEQHDEINQLISKPMAVSDWTDEDIEAELNDLVANQEAEKQLSDLSSLLPDVPSHNVSIPVADKDKKEGARKRPSSVLFS